jgi:hypothetical protein
LRLLEWIRRRRFAPFSLALDRRVRGPAERNARPVPKIQHSNQRENGYLDVAGDKLGDASIFFRFNSETKLFSSAKPVSVAFQSLSIFAIFHRSRLGICLNEQRGVPD